MEVTDPCGLVTNLVDVAPHRVITTSADAALHWADRNPQLQPLLGLSSHTVVESPFLPITVGGLWARLLPDRSPGACFFAPHSHRDTLQLSPSWKCLLLQGRQDFHLCQQADRFLSASGQVQSFTNKRSRLQVISPHLSETDCRADTSPSCTSAVCVTSGALPFLGHTGLETVTSGGVGHTFIHNWQTEDLNPPSEPVELV